MLCNLSCVLLIWEPPRRGTSNHFECGTDDVPHVDAVCRELSTKGGVESAQLDYIENGYPFINPGWGLFIILSSLLTCHLFNFQKLKSTNP